MPDAFNPPSLGLPPNPPRNPVIPPPAPVVTPPTTPAKPNYPSKFDIQDALENKDGLSLSPVQRMEKRLAAEREYNESLKKDPKKMQAVANAQASSFGIGKNADAVTAAGFVEPNKGVMQAPAAFAPKTPAAVGAPETGKVPEKTGNPAIDKAIKKFDTKGTDTKKLEDFWDKVSKFFTGSPEGDVTIWDFLEATGRAMAKNDQASTRTLRRDQQREERLIKEQRDAELAAKQSDRAWQEQQNALQRSLQLQLAGLRGPGGAPLNPAQLGAQAIQGGK